MFESLFQTFDDAGDSHKDEGAARLAALRDQIRQHGLDGFLVPRSDAHQNEYVPPSEERLAWLTGFTGSAGAAAVLETRAAVFVDGRYTVQARDQVDTGIYDIVDIAQGSMSDWLKANAPGAARIGFDPWLHTVDTVERLRKSRLDLVPVETNPIDAIWTDRPAPPRAPVELHDEALSGEAAADKIARVQTALAGDAADSLLLTDPHDIAWLFNIRGADVAHTPLPLAWALLPREGRPVLLIDDAKLSNGVRDVLNGVADLRDPRGLEDEVRALGAGGRKVLVDGSLTAERLRLVLEEAGAMVKRGSSPVQLLKAAKNATEIAGSRAAHLRDGAAVTRFLAWLDREAPTGQVDEITAAKALESFRRETGLLRDVSFPTISAAGPNAALPHYRVTNGSNRIIEPGLFLIDSGGQYRDGTTDITRTIAVGETTPEMRDCYTRVLKGHIAVATARLPKGGTGAQLDPFARRALWEAGADFDHGTGHGVGSYLSVHEGPQRISKTGHIVLQPGMILSNEPGYYREGAFGIRIENLVLVREDSRDGDERPMLAFETLTLAPIDTRSIARALMTADEIGWLDAYHRRVLDEIGPLVDARTRDWMAEACAPLG
jgi:Xaa-Pro aminopeptidase